MSKLTPSCQIVDRIKTESNKSDGKVTKMHKHKTRQSAAGTRTTCLRTRSNKIKNTNKKHYIRMNEHSGLWQKPFAQTKGSQKYTQKCPPNNKKRQDNMLNETHTLWVPNERDTHNAKRRETESRGKSGSRTHLKQHTEKFHHATQHTHTQDTSRNTSLMHRTYNKTEKEPKNKNIVFSRKVYF